MENGMLPLKAFFERLNAFTFGITLPICC
uniref:Uncharacterized protein n=1 Tax=Rhizophora mucronata TaxID=61149 RepID=A0A2P2N868_RHIMU